MRFLWEKFNKKRRLVRRCIDCHTLCKLHRASECIQVGTWVHVASHIKTYTSMKSITSLVASEEFFSRWLLHSSLLKRNAGRTNCHVSSEMQTEWSAAISQMGTNAIKWNKRNERKGKWIEWWKHIPVYVFKHPHTHTRICSLTHSIFAHCKFDKRKVTRKCNNKFTMACKFIQHAYIRVGRTAMFCALKLLSLIWYSRRHACFSLFNWKKY